MEPWIETYRGAVAPWECDITEHFTIAYYFDRIAVAEAALAAELGLIERLREGGFARRYNVRFARELRAGSAFHVESAPLGPEGGEQGGQQTGQQNGLRFGHRVVDSVGGEAITWFDVHWDGVDTKLPAGRAASWDGPEFEQRADPSNLAGLVPTAAGRVQPIDIDEFGRLGLCGSVHKFTDSSVQTGAAVGLTADYIKTARRGFSTFELRLKISGALGLGDIYRNRTGIAHLGNSSLRFLHVMCDGGGREVARLGQYGVQLDLDARRPAALAPELRERAEKLVLPAD
jgi:acyl-CoA thioesterase FadM